MMEEAISTTGGWKCAFCGEFVGHGEFHACVGYAETDRDNEIVVLLKRIIELLEQDKEK